MINIKIKNRILERHIKYLKGSPLCHNIQRLLEKNFLSTLKEEFGEIFVIQHSQFCHCLYEEYQKMDAGNNKNIFVGTPVYLHAFIQKVNQKYGEVQRTIETNQKYADYIYQTFGYDQFVMGCPDKLWLIGRPTSFACLNSNRHIFQLICSLTNLAP